VDALSVCDHIDFSVMSDFRVSLVDFAEIHWLDMILDSGDDCLRHYRLWMQVWRMQFRQEDHIFMIRCHVPIFGFPCSKVEMTFVAHR
jgi:hypothetical protein